MNVAYDAGGSIGAPMDRLLRYFLGQFIRRGTMIFTTATGSSLTFADGAGQLAKKRHLTAKLLIRPGHRVLDIGSGWGGLGLYLAEMAEADVTGITLSSEQLQVANARAADKNLTRSAKFLLQDYRDVTGPFDRIVSVGMFEHVGVDFYDAYFRRCAE